MYLNFDKALQGKSLEIIDKYVIVSQTDLEGIITNVSEAFCKVSGYTKDELVGRPHNIIRHEDMPKKIYENMWATIKSGKVWKGDLKNRAKDGSAYWVHATIEPNLNDQNEIIGYTAIRQDISDHKELEAQHSIIVQQSKSAAMGEMISMIAHQWRQPLQAVSLLAQKIPITKMLEGELSDEFIEVTTADILSQLDYMSSTIDDFRNFFKPDKAKENIHISKIIDQTIEFLSYMIKVDNIDMKVEVVDDVELHTFTNEIVQALINIIKNARDVLIEKRDVDHRKIAVKSYQEDSYCIIEITDNGGGIKEELLEKVFEPYFSTKTSKNGTGLGLYMVKTIIENHCNGDIFAQNTDEGAKFTISLPLN